MTDPTVELFERFLEQRRAGSHPDPAALIAEAGDQADALAGMIAAYLATHPRDDIGAEELLEFAARPELEPLGEWSERPRPWSRLLPELRARRGTTRLQLIRRLAEALGVAGCEPQVAGYVHELEAGLLPPAAVRPAVVAALAEILDVPRALLDSSRGLFEPPLWDTQVAFAREAPAPGTSAMRMFAIEPDPDPRVDDLFTGGGDG
jgi:hypothetical protein